MYNLTITATDRGQPQMTAIAHLIVNVGDINDVIPQFSQVLCTCIPLSIHMSTFCSVIVLYYIVRLGQFWRKVTYVEIMWRCLIKLPFMLNMYDQSNKGATSAHKHPLQE